jgi:hypothetical protein
MGQERIEGVRREEGKEKRDRKEEGKKDTEDVIERKKSRVGGRRKRREVLIL